MLFCQDKEIGVEAMERKRIEYIDWLRIISAIAVIGIHITMTQPNNYSVQEIGKSNYTNFPLLGIGFAIPLLWFIVFLLSWGGTFIMLKVPGINSLL